MLVLKTMFAALLVALATPASAQLLGAGDTIRIVAPFGAGGAVDGTARLIAEELREVLDQTVIVENHPGAGGQIGVDVAAEAEPDGSTLLIHTASHVIVPTYHRRAEEAAAQFTPLVRLGAVKFVLAVRGDLPAETLEEFIELGTTEELTYGSTGPGSTLHIAGAMAVDEFGIDAVHVPYGGLAPLFTDLVAGHIDFVVTSVTGIQPHAEGGRVRPLATFDTDRAEEFPDTPTTVELGYDELQVTNWYGILVRSDVPEDIKARLEEALLEVTSSPRVADNLVASGLRGVQGSDEFSAFVEAEFNRWPPTLDRLGIEPE